MEFYAIDVETANERITSICQIGIVHFSHGKIIDEWETFIDPKCEFRARNISIHGIGPEKVSSAPTIQEVYGEIFSRLNGNNIVCHGHFDRSSVIAVAEEKGFPPVTARRWVDSSRLATAVWEDFAKFGSKLSHVCTKLNIDLINHNALSDARAAATIVKEAALKSGMDFDSLHDIQYRPKCGRHIACNDDVNMEGIFYGETIVFTGSLRRTRHEAEDLALRVGCIIGNCVTKKTTLLVVGDRDVEFIQDHGIKSCKHKRADELIAAGHPIRILSEADFEAMISHIGR